MGNKSRNNEEKEEFGPLLARLYTFFATKSGKHQTVYSMISEDIASIHPTSILEIGSGPGIAAAMIAGKLPDVKIVCVDPSTTMTGIANRRFRRLSLTPRVTAMLGNSGSIDTDEHFDLIYTSLSFHHWKNGNSDLREIAKKYLSKGTIMIYENFIPDSRDKKNGKHQHGIGMKDIESMEIPGFVKSYEIRKELVVVKFSNISI